MLMFPKKVPDDSKDGHVLKPGSEWCCQGLLIFSACKSLLIILKYLSYTVE